jgi:NAD+ diphosphatase
MARVHWFIFCKEQIAILDSCQAELIEELSPYFIREIILNNPSGGHAIAAEIKDNTPVQLELRPLRAALVHMPQALLPAAIKAHFIIRWDKLHQYCGACGHKTTHLLPLFERRCDKCQLSFFPRISPCIIVRIHQDEQLLMTRSSHFPPGAYGLVAGFVEPGESAEDAVHREVKEETGLEIEELCYFGSQPWPFPDTLMLAFTAKYRSGILKIDTGELETGGWFHYENLPGRPSNPNSIASQLIDDFIHQKQKK